MHHADAHTDTGGDQPDATGTEDTLELRLTEELLALLGDPPAAAATGADASALVGDPGGWSPVTTSAGVFQLVTVQPERDLAVITRWMNDPAVAAFWELAGPDSVTAAHVGSTAHGGRPQRPLLGRPRRQAHELLGGLPRGSGPTGPSLPGTPPRHGAPSPHRRCAQPRTGHREPAAEGRRRSRTRQPAALRTCRRGAGPAQRPFRVRLPERRISASPRKWTFPTSEPL